MTTVVLGVGMFTFTIVTLVGLLMVARHQLVATGDVTITVNGDVSETRVRRLVELGHEQCYIANTLTCSIDVEPTVVSIAGRTVSEL